MMNLGQNVDTLCCGMLLISWCLQLCAFRETHLCFHMCCCFRSFFGCSVAEVRLSQSNFGIVQEERNRSACQTMVWFTYLRSERRIFSKMVEDGLALFWLKIFLLTGPVCCCRKHQCINIKWVTHTIQQPVNKFDIHYCHVTPKTKFQVWDSSPEAWLWETVGSRSFFAYLLTLADGLFEATRMSIVI